MKLYKIVFLIVFSVLLIVVGCTDRGVNNGNHTSESQDGTLFGILGAHNFSPELDFQILNKFQQLPMNGYLPKVAFSFEADGELKPIPILYLLPPQDGDQNFYFQHGLKELADELIASGEIQPMGIICIPNDKIYGGYFYGGSSLGGGDYDALVGGSLIDWAEGGTYFQTALGTKAKRGIGGIGMGAYGAYRAALLHPDKFGSVSGVAGPMDFDGADGASGLTTLFDDALNEQNIMGMDLENNYLENNSKLVKDTWHLSRLFVGAGIAFSSHETKFFYTDTIRSDYLIVGGDSTLISQEREYYFDSAQTLDQNVFPLANAISFPGTAVPPNAFIGRANFFYSFHLPFNNVGAIVPEVWDLWMNNNLDALLSNNPSAFDGVRVWIGNSSESTYGNYYEQTESWKATLNATPGIVVEEFNLEGYDGHPANKDQYVYDYLREMLIFHSESFGN